MNPHDAFTALCNSLRREGGKHSGNTKVIAIAFDGDMSVTFESFPDQEYADVAWSDMLRIVVNRYLDVWQGETFDRERALTSFNDDVAEIIDQYREEYGMAEEVTAAIEKAGK